jgi:hypothetical protein
MADRERSETTVRRWRVCVIVRCALDHIATVGNGARSNRGTRSFTSIGAGLHSLRCVYACRGATRTDCGGEATSVSRRRRSSEASIIGARVETATLHDGSTEAMNDVAMRVHGGSARSLLHIEELGARACFGMHCYCRGPLNQTVRCRGRAVKQNFFSTALNVLRVSRIRAPPPFRSVQSRAAESGTRDAPHC